MRSPFNQPLRGIRSPFGATTGNGLRVTAPALYFLSSAQPYTITGGNTISVADTKSAGGTYGVAISISSGALTLSGITGLSFSVGDGTADAAMTFTGSLTNINNALANSIISSATAGSRTISITLSHAATTRTVSKTVSVIVGVVVANSVAPVISGTLNYGNVLTCSDGTWTGTPAPTYTYQWQKNGTNISGQTASTYTTVFGDVGATITCEVTGSNPFNSVMVEATGVVILDPDAPVPVLTLIEDGLEEASPFYSMLSSAAGTLRWDFHSSATPPAAGAGDHLFGSQAIGSGITVWDTDLSAAAGETGYLHYRVTNGAGTSNILTSQVITVPGASEADTLLSTWADSGGGLAAVFTDITGSQPKGSMAIIDGATPANDWITTPSLTPFDKFTVARASTAYYFNSSGVLTQAASNVARIDYDPSTLVVRGLLVEEGRTNAVLYSNDLTNAAWTKTNVTAALTQTGVDGAANAATLLTATAGNGTCLQAITLGSSARYQTAFVKRITGSGTINMTMDNGTTWTAVTVTSSWTRVAIATQTLSNPTVGFRIVTSGDAIAVQYVQNENGTYATSPIPTTSASATREADDISLGVSVYPYNENTTTIFAVFTKLSAATRGIALAETELANGVSTGIAVDGQNNGQVRAYAENNGAEVSYFLSMGSYSANAEVRVAMANEINNANASYNGSIGSDDTTCNLPARTGLCVGSYKASFFSGHLNGHIKKIMVLPRRLSNANLQTLTT
jgi:hypothetical protein